MKVLFVSLGCDKNLVDTEEMLGMLSESGYQFTNDEIEADIIVINSCCFINDAKEESINTIIEMGRYKEIGKCKGLIVTGCLAQRYSEEIRRELPEVDAIIGTSSYDAIVCAIEDVKNGIKKEYMSQLNRLVDSDAKRVITTGGHYAHLKIAEGCNKMCTYCIIPKIRGNYRSVPMEKLVKRAEYLASQGVKELILVAQETTMYGVDIYGKKSLPKLLKELCKISGIQWIRIMYCYPEEIDDELIEVIKNEQKICKYLDMPIQHASDRILKLMGRRTNNADLYAIISNLRKEIPEIKLRTTLISGFPGETQEEHEILMKFVDEIEFDRLGVFSYSAEEGTPAANFEEQIEDNIKEDRRDEIMELQQEIAFDKAEDMIGKIIPVIIEGHIPDENAYVGRTYMDAPGIDGNIFITTDEDLMSGDFCFVKVTGALEYDLIGEICVQ
ncbi:MAG: 30S ribosomal protein S12 methylthiotransferase RimO [Lachnospiraceae bacterium]|nr:30S ribosomal protein S12 methylthiotransferase RimO [Lachnospiraceae bacterium]